MEGLEVSLTHDNNVIAGTDAEIFNDYQQRSYGTFDGGASYFVVQGNIASGNYSHAEGGSTTASASYSHAEGFRTTASKYSSHAEGQATTASGDYSHAEGWQNVASGSASHAEGERVTASGYCSHAEGLLTVAEGYYSHSSGYFTTAHSHSFAIGRFNNDTGTDDSAFNDPDLFIVGNGSGINSKSNIFRISDSGIYGSASFSDSGADYAEMFEWEDGNPNKEDRVGRFVTLHGEKICFANSSDDFILGVVSATPTVIGNSYEDQWCKMYVTDIFERVQYEDMEFPDELGPDGEVIRPAHTDRVRKINPDYNNTEKYIGRQDRSEWDAVGMMGKLIMIDDGTCQIDCYCKPGNDGIATMSSKKTRYRVIGRLDDTHIRILIL